MTISRTCDECGKTSALNVSDAGYREWQSGKLIQRALPELSDGERELLISGICGACFEDLFAGEDEL